MAKAPRFQPGRLRFSLVAIGVQAVIILLFGLSVRYSEDAGSRKNKLINSTNQTYWEIVESDKFLDNYYPSNVSTIYK